ncbi:MAG: hypothetical protein J7M38_09355, partial [Armatimonadetes bacterium]|nr:hypothetical protein [Armatimonadota bacterium]
MRRTGPVVLIVMAIALSGCSQGPPSMARLQAAVRAHPNSAKWHVALGKACLEQEMLHDAHVQFKRAVELDNTNY